jgi:hypothetical protein
MTTLDSPYYSAKKLYCLVKYLFTPDLDEKSICAKELAPIEPQTLVVLPNKYLFALTHVRN